MPRQKLTVEDVRSGRARFVRRHGSYQVEESPKGTQLRLLVQEQKTRGQQHG